MPLKFFLKLYLRLLGLAALVVVLCFTLFSGLNSVREQSWQEYYPAPLLRWLAAVPSPQQQYPWLLAHHDFRLVERGSLDASPLVQERLGYGQVVAVQTELGWRLLVLSPSGEVLEFLFRDTYREVAETAALIALAHLSEALPEDRDPLMAELSSRLAITLRPLASERDLPAEAVLGQVSERGIAFYRQGDSGRVLLRLADGSLVNLELPPRFDSWHWSVVLLLLFVAAGVMGAALLMLVRGVDQNLRAVESVAIRIARGELGARVEESGSTLVSRLASSFNGMAEHIQRLVGVQREMIHAVSHELRTPVARIRFGVQMLEGCDSAEALQKQLDGIDGDIQELDELIDEILTYARLEQGGPVFSLVETSVTDIVRQVVGEQQLIRPGIVIEADIAPGSEQWAMSDVEPRYIHRAIQNLVGNAARYANGRVRVRCQLDDDNCRVDVEDDGPGVPEEDWEKVFTAFARLDDSRTRNSGGYGLGLSIVRRILYWHGGQAFVCRSDDLGGARFSLVWPRKKSVV
ncbi:ATP-binding protein [Marinobacter zhejiangensis]|uniref:histidine kinase n=1 Tax=Marinobacter zhejiangensis TaxID=488535 RepID=A0A1I4N898_9GAMM|nr:ATP-binding protein [Marinobacter zhejiangensis]SFM11566.1 two-component system, OmpR family, sensor histidine kinase RstB [Marinobacter zhejiangensis]